MSGKEIRDFAVEPDAHKSSGRRRRRRRREEVELIIINPQK